MSQILIVESHSALRCELRDLLLSKGYEVVCAHTRMEVLHIVQTETIHLCLMDVDFPDCCGFSLCREMRKYYTKSIIMLTTYDQEEDVIKGLESGADDYITVPFSVKILLSRIEAQLRTVARRCSLPQLLFVGDLLFDFEACQVLKNGRSVQLGKAEFHIMEVLLHNRGKIVSRDYLLTHIWDASGKFIEDNTLSVHISRIRKALGFYQDKDYIETIKRQGYRWNIAVKNNRHDVKE